MRSEYYNEEFRILFVDDEPQLRLIVSQLLADFSSRIFLASDGLEALEIIRGEGSMDLLITDIRMPNLDGISLLTKLQGKFTQMKTIILTGNRNLESVSAAIRLGVYDFLDKPINWDVFCHRVAKALEVLAHQRRLNRLLEYLLSNLVELPIENYYALDQCQQRKILDAVHGLVQARLAKREIGNV